MSPGSSTPPLPKYRFNEVSIRDHLFRETYFPGYSRLSNCRQYFTDTHSPVRTKITQCIQRVITRVTFRRLALWDSVQNAAGWYLKCLAEGIKRIASFAGVFWYFRSVQRNAATVRTFSAFILRFGNRSVTIIKMKFMLCALEYPFVDYAHWVCISISWWKGFPMEDDYCGILLDFLRTLSFGNSIFELGRKTCMFFCSFDDD